jgi:hypothetical protein
VLVVYRFGCADYGMVIIKSAIDSYFLDLALKVSSKLGMGGRFLFIYIFRFWYYFYIYIFGMFFAFLR